MDIAEIRKKAKQAEKPEGEDVSAPAESYSEVTAEEKEESSKESPAPTPPDKAKTPLDLPEDFVVPTEEVYKKSLELEKAEEESIKILTFFLANEEYALEVGDIREIIKLREMTEVPNAPPFVPGIISLRGEVIPVADLRKRLGLQSQDLTRQNRIIIVSEEDKKVGLIVDSVTRVNKLFENELEHTPAFQEGIDVDFIKGICHKNGRLIILLNISKVLEW